MRTPRGTHPGLQSGAVLVVDRKRPDALIGLRALRLKYAPGARIHTGRRDAIDALIPIRVFGGDMTGRPSQGVPDRSEVRWVYDPSRAKFGSEEDEDSTPAVRRQDGI